MNRPALFLGAWLAVIISTVLLVSVVSRPRIGLNAFNGFTIFLGAFAAFLALKHPRLTLVSAMLLAAAAFPALIGGVGLLYLPSIALLIGARLSGT